MLRVRKQKRKEDRKERCIPTAWPLRRKQEKENKTYMYNSMSVLNMAWVPTGGLEVCYPQQIMTGKMEDNAKMKMRRAVLSATSAPPVYTLM